MSRPFRFSLFPNKQIFFLDVLSVTIWVYACLKLFAFDIDRAILSALAPQSLWLLDFRIITSALCILVALVLLGGKRLLAVAAYVVLFPLIITLWKLPVVFFRLRGWVLRLAFINLIFSAFTNIRHKLLYFIAYSTALVCIVFINSDEAKLVASTILICCVVSSYCRSFPGAFRAPRVFALYKKAFGAIQNYEPSKSRDKIVSPLSGLPADTSRELVNDLQIRVFVNRSCVFFSSKFRDYNKSEVHVVAGIATLLYLAALTLITFSLLYSAAVYMDPNGIEGGPNISAFEYIYTAYDNMFFGTNSSLELVGQWPKTLSIIQRGLSTALIVIFAAILFEIRKRRHTQEIEDAVTAAENAARAVEVQVATDYSYANMAEAMEDLAKIESSLYSALLKIISTFNKTDANAPHPNS